MSAKPAVTHDAALFEALLRTTRDIDPEVRPGKMFGCPAVFWGRKMAVCVMETDVGMRVPQPVAASALEAGRVRHFQPYGKKPMQRVDRLRRRSGRPARSPRPDPRGYRLRAEEQHGVTPWPRPAPASSARRAPAPP